MLYLQIIIGIILILTVISFTSLAPWVPTKKDDLQRLNKIINLKSGEKFLEMGCGTAIVSLFVAKNNPDSQIVGIELSLLIYIYARIKIFFSFTKNIKIIYGNALKLKLEDFDVIYVFGLPVTVSEKVFPLINKIKKENFRFISYCFQMQNDYFIETKYKEDRQNAIYEYKQNITPN